MLGRCVSDVLVMFCMTSERSGNNKHGELTVQSQAVGLTQYGLSCGDEKRSKDRKWFP